MADLAPGDYNIVCYGNTNLALDVTGAGTKDGSNVEVYTRNYTDAQAWSVQLRPDGTYRFLSRWCGKCLDLYSFNVRQGGNVNIWTDNDTRAQQWYLLDTGLTANLDGYEGLVVYKIRLYGYDDWLVETVAAPGAVPTSGTNIVCSHDEGSSTDQMWVFVPLPLYKDSGVYEICSLMDVSNGSITTRNSVWDIEGESMLDGGNLMGYPPNDSNNQKFILEQAGDYWKIRAVHSLKYIGAESAETTANIVQGNGVGDLYLWTLTNYGTINVLGKQSQVVEISLKGHTDLMIDEAVPNGNWAAYAQTMGQTYTPSQISDLHEHGAKFYRKGSTSPNIYLHTKNQGANQDWALYPTVAIDKNMPTPHTIGIAESVKGNQTLQLGVKGTNGVLSKRVYPTWSCSDAWATDGSNHYMWRRRTRKLGSITSTWGEWTSWTAWETPSVTQVGTNAWVTDGVLIEYAMASYKSLEMDIEVKATGEDTLQLLEGPSGGATCTIAYMPTVIFSSAVWSPRGLTLNATVDYNVGQARVWLTSLKAAGKEILSKPMTVLFIDGKFTIEQDFLLNVPANGAALQITFSPGTDQIPRFEVKETATVTLTYGDSTGSLTPILSFRDDLTIRATVPSGTMMWCIGDTLRKANLLSDDGTDAVYEILYPFGVPFRLFAANDTATWTDEYPVTGRRIHAWHWDGGSSYLECRKDEVVQTTYSLKAQYSSYLLNTRRRETVKAAKGFSSSFSASGTTVPGSTLSDPENFIALQEAIHVVYRSPSGMVRDVAVIEVGIEERTSHADVVVNMIEEAL